MVYTVGQKIKAVKDIYTLLGKYLLITKGAQGVIKTINKNPNNFEYTYECEFKGYPSGFGDQVIHTNNINNEYFVPAQNTKTLNQHFMTEDKFEIAVKALNKIANWQLPATGKYWGEGDITRPVSYEAEYGSNGVRDYIKNIAKEALNKLLND